LIGRERSWLTEAEAERIEKLQMQAGQQAEAIHQALGDMGLNTMWSLSHSEGKPMADGGAQQGQPSGDRRGAARYFLAAEHRPSMVFTAETRIRWAPSPAAGCPGRLSPSGGTTVPLTSTRCPSSVANSASCPESE
jgi:hypothetical protein